MPTYKIIEDKGKVRILKPGFTTLIEKLLISFIDEDLKSAQQ